MRFGFWFDYDQTYTFVSLFNEFLKRLPNSRVSGFVVNDRYYSHAIDNLPPGSTLIHFYDLVAEGSRHVPDAAALADLHAMDERHCLSRVAYSDRHLHDWQYQPLIGLYVYLVDAFRKYIDRENPDVFIFNGIASQYSHLLYLVLIEKGVKVVIPTHAGVEDLFYLTDNPYLHYDRAWDLFKAMQDGRDQPTAEERIWAERFIDHIRHGGSAYVSSAIEIEQRKFALPGPSNLLRVLAYLKNYFLYDRFDPTLPNPWRRMKSMLRLRRNRRKALKYFRCGDDIGDDFVIYLLHFEPEIATLLLSQYDQKSFIDIIARQLPLLSRLVVKEHPVMVGQRDWTFYEDLTRRYPNIVFVDPNTSTKDLVKRGRAVVTLSGTIIVEAFALQKPVIYTARSRFGGFGLGSFTQEFLNFGKTLAASSSQVPSDVDVVNMLSALHRRCFRCKFVEPLGDPEVLAQGNIETIATAILRHLKAA